MTMTKTRSNADDDKDPVMIIKTLWWGQRPSDDDKDTDEAKDSDDDKIGNHGVGCVLYWANRHNWP